MKKGEKKGEKRKVQWNEKVETKEFKRSKGEFKEFKRNNRAQASASAAQQNVGGDEDMEEEEEEETSTRLNGYSLDSDDEDEEATEVQTSRYELTDADKHETLDEEFDDGGTAITGFNLDEEMEEGHFDESGNYFESKDNNHEGDRWLENVAPTYVAPTKGGFKPNFTEDVETVSKDDRPAILKKMLTLVKPGESVQRALRRLGGATGGARKWQAQKKAKKPAKEEAGLDLNAFAELTSCADQLASAGEYDVYQYLSEKIGHELKKVEAEERLKLEAKANEEAKASGKANEALDDEKVYFEYKWKEDGELFGPYSAEQMCEWQDQGFFKDGVMCRELHKTKKTTFYDSKRVDFDLYT